MRARWAAEEAGATRERKAEEESDASDGTPPEKPGEAAGAGSAGSLARYAIQFILSVMS